jgi:hypothetical protein
MAAKIPRSRRDPRPDPFGAVPDEEPIAIARERLARQGLRPFSLPLGVDIARWLARARTPWTPIPTRARARWTRKRGPLAAALLSPDVTLHTGVRARRPPAGSDDAADSTGAEVDDDGERRIRRAGTGGVVGWRGAIGRAAAGLGRARRRPAGIANRSDQVGRHFMNHNSLALLAVDLRLRNSSVYQKTIGLNDFYFDDGDGGPPLGNVQLLGKITAPILKANIPLAPLPTPSGVAAFSFDWYLMSEDLPDPESRVRLDGDRIVLQWRRTNMRGHAGLVRKMREVRRAAGFPIAPTSVRGAYALAPARAAPCAWRRPARARRWMSSLPGA